MFGIIRRGTFNLLLNLAIGNAIYWIVGVYAAKNQDKDPNYAQIATDYAIYAPILMGVPYVPSIFKRFAIGYGLFPLMVQVSSWVDTYIKGKEE